MGEVLVSICGRIVATICGPNKVMGKVMNVPINSLTSTLKPISTIVAILWVSDHDAAARAEASSIGIWKGVRPLPRIAEYSVQVIRPGSPYFKHVTMSVWLREALVAQSACITA